MNGQFSRQGPVPPNPVPLLGQQGTEAQQKAQMTAGLLQAVQQLSLKIYVQLAAGHVGTRDGSRTQESEREHLQQLARESFLAAQAYFEGLNIAQFDPKPPQPAKD